MLIGEYRHTIDSKKRLSVPSKLRQSIGDRMVITRGLDSCLFLFPIKEWDRLSEKLGDLPMGQQNTRGFVRLLLSGASEVELDQLGRILIPDFLKNYASLKKNVVVTGVFNRLEIWDQDSWDKYRSNLEEHGDEIAEKLGELGMI